MIREVGIVNGILFFPCMFLGPGEESALNPRKFCVQYMIDY